MSLINRELVEVVRAEFGLDWRGIHGVPHWARVRFNGLAMSRRNGADAVVVELFAFVHDVRREDDGRDPFHGERAADLVGELDGTCFSLSSTQRVLLETACREHSDGGMRGDVTVRTCWDADRLDLGRVGIKPDPHRLCTDEAREPGFLELAYSRSVAMW